MTDCIDVRQLSRAAPANFGVQAWDGSGASPVAGVAADVAVTAGVAVAAAGVAVAAGVAAAGVTGVAGVRSCEQREKQRAE